MTAPPEGTVAKRCVMQRNGTEDGPPVRVAIDAMGGDFAPVETVKGALQALRSVNAELLSGRRSRFDARRIVQVQHHRAASHCHTFGGQNPGR